MLTKPSQYRNKKAQSAMEYLMTYGWAILIIAVVLGALFSLGVFSGSSLLGNACVASSGFLCQNPLYSHIGANILATVGQNTGQTWSTVNFIFVPEGTPVGAGGLPSMPGGLSANTANTVAGDANTIYGYSGTYIIFGTNSVTGGMTSGQTLPIWLPVNGLTGTNVTVGRAATGAIWAAYTTSANPNIPQYVQVATINIKAS